jgi:succinate dehydrogenase cytochrome b556 subunit
MKQRIRPLSPHLTVYKPQLTSLLSIFHRVAGSLLGFILIIFFLVLNLHVVFSGSSFQYCFYFDFFSVIPVLFVSYFFLGVIFYHVTNGVRHLSWDLALGLDIKNLNTTGLIVLALVFCVISVIILI